MLTATKNEIVCSSEFVCSLAASSSQVRLFENRVRASAGENQTLIGAADWLTSTLRWGSAYRCDGTASGSLDQRYYASSYGRFNTVDPLRRSARSDRPLTWDRFVYCEDDPVNCSDPTGLIDWGRVTLGGVQLVGGVSGGIFLGLTVPGTLFGSLPLVIPGAIAAGGAIAIGAGNIMAGLTASGSTVSPSTVQGMSSASDLSNAGGLVCGAVTGGNSAAIQACSAAANTVSFAVDAASVANTSSIGEAAAGAVALINDVGAAVPGPVVLPGTSITVADTVGSLPVYTSEVGSNLTFDGDGVSNLDVL